MLCVMQNAIPNRNKWLELFGSSGVRDLIMLHNDLLMTGENLFVPLEIQRYFISGKRRYKRRLIGSQMNS